MVKSLYEHVYSVPQNTTKLYFTSIYFGRLDHFHLYRIKLHRVVGKSGSDSKDPNGNFISSINVEYCNKKK